MSTHIIVLALAGVALAAFEVTMAGRGGRYRIITVAVVVSAFVLPAVPGGGIVLAIAVPLLARRLARPILGVLLVGRAKRGTRNNEAEEATAS